jgi:hypothetical protein
MKVIIHFILSFYQMFGHQTGLYFGFIFQNRDMTITHTTVPSLKQPNAWLGSGLFRTSM